LYLRIYKHATDHYHNNLSFHLVEAKKTDFTSIEKPVDFLNAVFNEVLNCAGSGMAVMADLADISDLKGNVIPLLL